MPSTSSTAEGCGESRSVWMQRTRRGRPGSTNEPECASASSTQPMAKSCELGPSRPTWIRTAERLFACRCPLLRFRRFRPAAVPIERLWIEIDHDILCLGVEVHGVAAQLPAETALLVAAEGRLGRVDRRVVDADIAGLQASRQGVGALDVVRPDRRGQSVDRRVGGLHDLVLGGEGDYRQHRAEDLLLGKVHVLPHPVENGRGEKIAGGEIALCYALAAGDQLRTLLLGALAVGEDAAGLGWRDDRTHLRLVLEGIADADLAR